MNGEDGNCIVRRLFALLTAKMEDGSAIASDGQAAGVDVVQAHNLSKRLHSISQECVILADAINSLSARDSCDTHHAEEQKA